MPLASLWMSFIAPSWARQSEHSQLASRKDPVDPLHHVPIVKGSQKLRVVIFEEGDTMPSERDIKLVAQNTTMPAVRVADDGNRVTVGGRKAEAYIGIQDHRRRLRLCATHDVESVRGTWDRSGRTRPPRRQDTMQERESADRVGACCRG